MSLRCRQHPSGAERAQTRQEGTATYCSGRAASRRTVTGAATRPTVTARHRRLHPSITAAARPLSSTDLRGSFDSDSEDENFRPRSRSWQNGDNMSNHLTLKPDALEKVGRRVAGKRHCRLAIAGSPPPLQPSLPCAGCPQGAPLSSAHSAERPQGSDYRIAPPNVDLAAVPDFLKKDCLLFYYPDCEARAGGAGQLPLPLGAGCAAAAARGWRARPAWRRRRGSPR